MEGGDDALPVFLGEKMILLLLHRKQGGGGQGHGPGGGVREGVAGGTFSDTIYIPQFKISKDQAEEQDAKLKVERKVRPAHLCLQSGGQGLHPDLLQGAEQLVERVTQGGEGLAPGARLGGVQATRLS